MNFRLQFLLWCEVRHCNRAHAAYRSAMDDVRHFERECRKSRVRIESLNRRLRGYDIHQYLDPKPF